MLGCRKVAALLGFVGEVSWLDCVDGTVRARELYTRDRPGKRIDRGEVEIACVALRAEGRMEKVKMGMESVADGIN